MFLVNSRYRLFAETSFCSGRRAFTYKRHTLSRSYGVNLPSSLTRLLSSALVFSTCPPVSVSGTVPSCSSQYAAFLGSVGSITYGITPWDRPPRFIPTVTPYTLAPPSTRWLTYPSPSLLCSQLGVREYSPVFHQLRLSATP